MGKTLLDICWGKGGGNILVCHWIFTVVNLFVMIPTGKCDVYDRLRLRTIVTEAQTITIRLRIMGAMVSYQSHSALYP
ncbi:hypothetical protein IQ277_08560 [Nostocales cyanobacterium LEGE 12452]|nr:hypothetical protein [Nostocales cyanobacterium LEGE 12452]